MARIAAVSNPIFQAEWPESLKPTFLGNVARTLYAITPIGIAHNILFWLGRFLVHPASSIHLLDPAERQKLLSMGGRIVQFKTPDGETLEGMLFKSRVASHERKGIVFAPGNGFCIDQLSDQVEFFKNHVEEADLLFLNYRGVGNSTGSSSPTGLALDVYSACEYLYHEREVEASRQVVYGHSLGGYAAVKGGALFQKAHPDEEVSVVSDRSFICLSVAAARIAGVFFYALAFVLGWELDARADWDVFKGKKIVIYDKDDGLIPFVVSFFKAVENKSDTCAIEMDSEGTSDEPHVRPFTRFEARKIGREIDSAFAG